LESHRNAIYAAMMDGPGGQLQTDIVKRVNHYLGLDVAVGGPLYSTTAASFLGIQQPATLTVVPTQVWQIVTLSVYVQPVHIAWINSPWNQPHLLEVKKYVPNRDRPIAFVLPGLH
jgi:hypothetical protein